jgi:hypothetical protein
MKMRKLPWTTTETKFSKKANPLQQKMWSTAISRRAHFTHFLHWLEMIGVSWRKWKARDRNDVDLWIFWGREGELFPGEIHKSSPARSVLSQIGISLFLSLFVRLRNFIPVAVSCHRISF